MKQKILIVDDEQDLCDILLLNLSVAGYDAVAVNSGEEALQQLRETAYDLVLLDVMMPGLSGFDVAERLQGRVPIIFLTALGTEDCVLQGFRLGADDYIAKPFSVKQVVARVKAVLARTTSVRHAGVVACEGLTMQTDTKTLSVDGIRVAFTKTEFLVLQLLMSQPGHVFSRQELIDHCWPSDVVVTDRTVDVNITRIRKKIRPYDRYLVTRQGFGYCFEGGADL